ncbi:HAMP domain-containing histidine kinase [Clostridium sp. 19966]|uniref:sensor histidine kinase n=1 Tax=Clostridium sp. 19966 TaxID=2768166 RepID=UPI0028E00622|nr:HAMP domain-containing sensor histidine kinase [Clostridium sp. 19966]MDT8716800.1 HAMP domain-containing histidine kinase [Clostridium sp. 19966]
MPSLMENLYRVKNLFDFVFNSYALGIIIFILYFHILFRKKIICFLKINKSVKLMSQGDFEIRINGIDDENFGDLAKSINDIMNKFNNSLQEEKRSEQTKIDLITSVSHDLRTPLTSILGYLNLINEDKYKDEIALRYYADIVYSKAKRLKNLIDDLFELTTLNNYGFRINKEKINLVEFINQLIMEHRLEFQSMNMECRTYFPQAKVEIFGDGNKLVRAFENLISNSIKYSKCSPFMDIYVNTEEDFIRISFINYGDPIPPLDIPYVFDRFYRSEKSRSEATGGSGLGLAITKNIIELHDGKIEVKSSAEKTTFEIRLPLVLQENNKI